MFLLKRGWNFGFLWLLILSEGTYDPVKFTKRVDLSNLKLEINKLDIGKLETTLVDLSELSDVLKNKIVRKTVYDELVKNFNAIKTTYTKNLVEEADYIIKIAEIEKKLLDCDHNNKYVATEEFNKLMADTITLTLA